MAKAKKHKLTSEEIEKLMGMALRYGAFTMWALTEQPKTTAKTCESILNDGAKNLSKEQVEALNDAVDAADSEDALNRIVNTLIDALGGEARDRFKNEVGGAFWHSQNCWNVEKTFIALHQEKNVYEACSSFMHDHIKFVASKVEEHGSMEKFIETLPPPPSYSDASSS